MLITRVKDREILRACLDRRPRVVQCFGCREVLFPEAEIDAWLEEHREEISGVFRYDYLCREEFSRAYLEQVAARDPGRGPVIVFSCGVGVQVIAGLWEQTLVVPGCDTSYLNGFQGLTALNDDCRQCGECRLNETGGICPLTACSKGLLNGPCGGAREGKCEVSSSKECGWELIYRRLKESGRERDLRKPDVFVQDYRRIITEPPAFLSELNSEEQGKEKE